MKFEEFEAHSRRAIAAFRDIRALIAEKDGYKKPGLQRADVQRIEFLQDEAAAAIGAIDHVIDRFGKRKCHFGNGDRLVDKFTTALSISDGSGSSMLEIAGAELQQLTSRLRGQLAGLARDEVARLLAPDPATRISPPPERAKSMHPMTFGEFERRSLVAIRAFSTVRSILREKGSFSGPGLTSQDRQQIDELQDQAAESLGAIEHILDRYAERICQFGDGYPDVDMFDHALAIRGTGGSSILDTAVGELRLLVPKLKARFAGLLASEVGLLLGRDMQATRIPSLERAAQAVNSSQPNDAAGEGRFDVFLSYATEDRPVAEDIANKLRTLNLVVFMAHDTITTGATWRSQVDAALRRCEMAVLLLSRTSLQSDWVRYEIGAVWALGKPAAPALIDCDIASVPELLRDFQARSVAAPSDRSVFCREVERLVRDARRTHASNS